MAVKARTRQKMKKFSTRIRKLKDKKQRYGTVIDQFKRGQLLSSSGHRVKNPKQARAIAYSMAYGRKTMRVQGRPKKEPKKPSLLSRAFAKFTRKKARS
jgi:hypothetical protein